MNTGEIIDISDDEFPSGGQLLGSKPMSSSTQRPIKSLPSRAVDYVSTRQQPTASGAPTASQAPTKDALASQVLEIVPDVEPSHLMELIDTHLETRVEGSLERIIQALLEAPDYPKQAAGKRKLVEDESSQPNAKNRRLDVDYMDINRRHDGTASYGDLAVAQLMSDFPFIPKPFIRKILSENHGFYAPTHFSLLDEQSRPSGRFKPKGSKSKVSGKSTFNDPLFAAERAWIEAKVLEDSLQRDQAAAECIDEAENGGIDCGCCFTAHSFHKMVQCEEGHLFCRECMVQYCETLLGEQNHIIRCMDQSSCKALFPQSELQRILTDKLMSLYLRIKQHKEIVAAGLSNLEECPFCDFKIVIDNEHEKLFRCQNEDCMAVSCRQCKKTDHLPKSCQEMEDDRRLDGKHAVEEALSKALMRNCPNCQKSFIKEEGCNKMTCPECKTLSCYICRQVISGYDHFDQTPRHLAASAATSSKSKKKCSLWDTSDINEEIEAAAKQAVGEVKAANPDLAEADIAVEVPRIAQAPAAAAARAGLVHQLPAMLPQLHNFGLQFHHLPHAFDPRIPQLLPYPALQMHPGNHMPHQLQPAQFQHFFDEAPLRQQAGPVVHNGNRDQPDAAPVLAHRRAKAHRHRARR